MPLEQPFSKRNHYSAVKEITIRESAPQNLRYYVLQSAYDFGQQPLRLLRVLCKQLRRIPESDEGRDYEVRQEVQMLVHSCEWYQVYDFIEALHAQMVRRTSIWTS